MISMGLFSMRRHHLQNAANRGAIADRKARQAAERAAAETQREHDQALGAILAAERRRIEQQTQADRVRELLRMADDLDDRGRANDAAGFRIAAEVVQRMDDDEFAEHKAARLRHDGTAGVNALVRRHRSLEHD
jgi:hypothetical protein